MHLSVVCARRVAMTIAIDQTRAWAAVGESKAMEFKRATGERRRALCTLCAMLNNLGGRGLFGVEAEGRLSGQQVSGRTIEEIAQEKRLGISVCLGTVDHRLYDELRQAGARGYIIKLETGDPEQYRLLQCPGTIERRLEAIRYLVRTGWCVSSGLIHGLPNQTLDQLIATLDLLRSLTLRGCSVSPFIPGEGTPLFSQKRADLDQTLNAVAVLRLSSPRWIVPAVSALNLCDSSGYVRALRAGANLATINLTPSEWRGDYQLYRRKRWIMTEERVLQAIEQAGCQPSPESWIAASSSFPPSA